jgi:ABC-type transport system involved in multi-copper enzyme maturation permease subunit
MILSKPAGRGAFLGAKLVAIGITLAVAVAIAAAGAWFYTLVLFEALPVGGFVASAVLQWLTLFAWASITFLGSTLTRSSLAAAGLGIVAFIVVGIAGAIPAVEPYVPTGLGKPAHAIALGAPAGDLATPLIATIILIAAAIAASWLAFRRQEL